MSDQEFPLRLASPAELREMVQTLTRERDEARRLHMGQAGRAAGWRARARYAREALERLIELVADAPEAKDSTTPLCVAVTVARAEVTAIEEAERRDADRSTPPLELTVREAARQRVPLDGADAQALEGALALTERERDEARADAARLRGDIETALEMLRDSWGEDAIAGGDDQVAVVLQRALAGEGE